MKTHGRSNALLVELLIVVMFFMLAAAFLMQMFAAARIQGEKAGILNDALVSAQNTAEWLYAAEDPEKALEDRGFAFENGIWRSDEEGLVTEVEFKEEDMTAGRLLSQTVRVSKEGEQLIELPVARYEEVGQ